MEKNKVYFRHLMLFYFQKGKNAVQTAKKICAVYGNDAIAESTVRKWFARFRIGNFDLEDRERSGKPAVVDDDQIVTLIENNPRHTTRDIAEILHISHMSVVRYLKTFGYVNRYDIWLHMCD
ncbi:Histone-lysine N-methyltransferase SETMAR [Formica fusca]